MPMAAIGFPRGCAVPWELGNIRPCSYFGWEHEDAVYAEIFRNICERADRRACPRSRVRSGRNPANSDSDDNPTAAVSDGYVEPADAD